MINLTTGPGGGFYPTDEDPNRGSPESTMMTPEARVQHVLELRPEICSLGVATMNFGKRVFVNVPDHLVKMASLVESAGVRPEIEVFSWARAPRASSDRNTRCPSVSPLPTVPWSANGCGRRHRGSADDEALFAR
ncbi:3-keto-5-aminohexanoate cleavage protein [Paraburkholderia sp. EG286A]|uniref:3-keto-5-aminohexanoate cleavage protein n=1 Tax=Paraburkholderia sp. EG286A TaxID=3237014 RepID=UPI0034D34B6F